MTELAWDRLPWPTAHLLDTAQGPQVKTRDRMPKDPKRGGGTTNREGSQLPPVFQVSGLGPYDSGMCHPIQVIKPVGGELMECGSTPHQHQLQQLTVGPQHSLPDHKPNPTTLKVVQKRGWPEVAPVPFLNPDSVTYLVGCSNKTPVIVGGWEMTTLIDSGAPVSNISFQFCGDLVLQIQLLGELLELEGTGGSTIPYLWFMEVNLQIQGIKIYNEDVLMLVISTTTYSETVPVMVGSKIKDRALSLMTKSELVKATTTWRQAHFGAVMSGLLQLPCTSSNKTRVEKEVSHSSLRDDPVKLRNFCLNDVRGPVKATKFNIPPFSTVRAHQFQCQRTLDVGPCAHGTDARSPVAYSSSTDGDLWRITSGVHKGTSLSAQLEHPYHGNSHKDCGWTGCPCQPRATGSLPDQDFQRVQWQTPKGMDLGGSGPPRPQRMAWTRAKTGQKITAQIVTPVCMQWPGPGQNCSDQA